MTSLERHGNIWVLHLGDGDNRFNADSNALIHAALNEVEANADTPSALVTTASGKIWSNGLDLDYLSTLGSEFIGFIDDVQQIFRRLLELPMPTIAAVQGHAFAGGAMLALAHDVRIMRGDRGYLCLPEIDLGMTFTDGMAALIAAKVPSTALRRLAVFGERMDGATAQALGVVDEIVDGEAGVVPLAVERAAALAGKAGATLSGIRRNFYSAAIDALRPSG
jgi:enoyl-CoA hydratase/carnithine racemase